MEEEWKRDSRQQILAAFSKAEKELKPPVIDMFNDVYDSLSHRLRKQHQECMNHVAKYPEEYPTELHAKDENSWVATLNTENKSKALFV